MGIYTNAKQTGRSNMSEPPSPGVSETSDLKSGLTFQRRTPTKRQMRWKDRKQPMVIFGFGGSFRLQYLLEPSVTKSLFDGLHS
jgi:hypothetical protein